MWAILAHGGDGVDISVHMFYPWHMRQHIRVSMSFRRCYCGRRRHCNTRIYILRSFYWNIFERKKQNLIAWVVYIYVSSDETDTFYGIDKAMAFRTHFLVWILDVVKTKILVFIIWLFVVQHKLLAKNISDWLYYIRIIVYWAIREEM